VAAEAIEALHADKSAEAPSSLPEQPQEPERMADSDRVGRPICFALRAACDKAEIDEGDFGAVEMAHEVSPDAGMEAPAMDEHETHLVALHDPSLLACVLGREHVQKTIDVGLLMRGGEG